MTIFVFKTNDEEIAFVDTDFVLGAVLNNYQESILITLNTREVAIHIENEKDRKSEFLRLTTAIQESDEAKEELHTFMISGGQSH